MGYVNSGDVCFVIRCMSQTPRRGDPSSEETPLTEAKVVEILKEHDATGKTSPLIRIVRPSLRLLVFASFPPIRCTCRSLMRSTGAQVGATRSPDARFSPVAPLRTYGASRETGCVEARRVQGVDKMPASGSFLRQRDCLQPNRILVAIL